MNEEKTYSEKLKDPRWQKRRLEIFERDQFTCQHCLDNKKPLHVHHRRYVYGKEPWDYDPHDLVTLCENCHETERDLLPDAKQHLMEAMSKCGFNANDIMSLGWILNGAPGHPRQFLALIEFVARDRETYDLVSERFREWLRWVQSGCPGGR